MMKPPPLNRDTIIIQRALISVSNKQGLADFARHLNQKGIEILSTGGTARVLREAQIPVTDISDYTHFPEIMDGRVKTLHPKVAGGILGLRDRHQKEAGDNHLQWIDLVVCNLYPFSETIQEEHVSLEEALEQIDIGGPTLIRSAAKNLGWVGVVVDPQDYEEVLNEVNLKGGLTFATRRRLAQKAFAHTAQYDTIIHHHLETEAFPETLNLTFNRKLSLRYGENPHQSAAAYEVPNHRGMSILQATVHQGKQLSYNNLMDADGALACLREFEKPACVVVKHTNPCGVAVGEDLLEVYTRAFDADRLSAFGGIIALNRPCTAAVAEAIAKVFVEIVLAPQFEPEALQILSRKKNLRVLETGPISPRTKMLETRPLEGGLLVQETNLNTVTRETLRIVTERKPSAADVEAMLFAWKVLKYVKSNAIVIAGEDVTVGIGAGQVSRVEAVEIALRKGGERVKGAVLASDAFFPFRDSIDLLAGKGIRAVIQPGGSIRDREVIEACDEHGIAMVFTGVRCFKH